MFNSLLNGQSISTFTSLVGLDAFPRLDHVLALEHMLKQVRSPQSFGSWFAEQRALLTSRSVLRRRPFRHEARSHQVRTRSFPAQPQDLRDFDLTTGFAVMSLLALLHRASYPILVDRLMGSFRAFTSKIAPMLGAHIPTS